MMVLNGRYKKLPKHVLKLPLTSSRLQLEPTPTTLVSAKFQKGDLVYLNAFARVLCVESNNARIGIIMSYPRNYYLRNNGEHLMYWVYDIFVGTELITDVPQDFLIGLEKYADENDIE
jgi:hypothetical protein